ncbi:reticulon-1-B-like isoform X2 [Carcharodon carcharias]|nr:reticulon-1-B-like isoform X2 [Carcharodon carcharias]
MSLESTLSCGTPLGQPSCFPGVFPTGTSPDLTVRDFDEGTNGPGAKRPSESDAPPRTKGRTSVPRGVVRTETIETFLAEEEDDMEEDHVHLLEVTDQHKGKVERGMDSDLRDRPDWNPSQSTSAPTALESALTCQGPEETGAPELRVSGSEMEPQGEGTLKGHLEPEPLSMEESRDWEGREVFEVQSAEGEAEADKGRFVEGGASNQSDVDHGPDPRLSTEPGVTDGEMTPSVSSPPPVTEAEGTVDEVEVEGATEVRDAAGVEIPPGTMESLGRAEEASSIDVLMPTGAEGIVDAVLPGRCDCCVNTNSAVGCRHPLTLVTAPSGHETQEVTEEEAYAENWQSPQQPSALDQSDHSKSQGLEAVDQSATDLLYWEDVKKTGTLFGAIILILFSLTQFSGISVLAYLTLSILSVTMSLRLYTSALHLIYKTQEVHPFQTYLDLDINLSQEQLRKYSEIIVLYVTSAISQLRRLFLVEDLLDSLKFGVLLWLMTYVGAVFNGLTLTILVAVAVFIVPLVYRKHKVHINQYLGLVRGHIQNLTSKIQAKLPGSKPKAE